MGAALEHKFLLLTSVIGAVFKVLFVLALLHLVLGDAVSESSENSSSSTNNCAGELAACLNTNDYGPGPPVRGSPVFNINYHSTRCPHSNTSIFFPTAAGKFLWGYLALCFGYVVQALYANVMLFNGLIPTFDG